VSQLSIVHLFALAIAVSLMTFLGEAIGIGLVFRVSPLRVLETIFNFDVGIRPRLAGACRGPGRRRH
jgi:methionine sulfoxide reductase heme-binding subunit